MRSEETLHIEQEAEGLFDLSQDICWEVAEFAFKVWFDEGPDPLDVDHGGVVEKREVSHGNFVEASTMLRGERDVDNEGAWRVGIISRNDKDWAPLRCQPEIGQPDLPWLSFHREYRGLSV